MEARAVAVKLLPGYDGRILGAPLPGDLAASLLCLLGDKGEPWLADIEARAAGDGLDLFAVAFHDWRPVAHSWIGSSHRCPESGLLGHVFTAPEHRRRGLAATLMDGLLGEFDTWGGRWVQLHTTNPEAARLYARLGFRTILEGRADGSSKGGWLMLRGGDGGGVGESYHRASGRWTVETCERPHGPSLCVFLNAVPGRAKLPSLGIDSGMDVELKLLKAYEAQQRGELRCSVLSDAANGRPHGLACSRAGGVEVYAPRVSEEARAMLAARAAAFR